jgi:outer membrane autotransporter protein
MTSAGDGVNVLTFGAITGGLDQSITGAITTVTAEKGTVIVNNTTGKTATFNSTIGSATHELLLVDVKAGKTAVFKEKVISVGATLAAGTDVTFNQNANLVGTIGGNAGVLTIGGANSILRIGSGIVAGESVIDITTTTGTAGDAVVFSTGLTVKAPSNFTTGSITLIDGDVADTITDAEALLITASATPLTTFAVTKSGGVGSDEDITITATAKSDATTASELGVNTNKAAGLRAAVLAAATQGTDTTLIDNFTTVLNAGTTTDTDVANQVAPQTDIITGSTIAAKAVTSGVQNVISTRLASLRSGDAYSAGVVTGNGMAANSGFIQAFGSTVEQKNKGNEFGYDADTTGFAIGVDGKVDGGAVIGISYARSEADVDGKGTGRAKNDITTDSVSLYADYATKDGYIEGSITYGQSENKGSRIINTGDLDRTYSSDYDSEQYSFRLSGGVPQSVGTDAFITPFATATISQIKADAYTERSTTADDALRLRVNQDTVDSQVGSIGVKYHQVIKDGNTTFTPEIKVAVNQEFGDGSITTTNTYQGGGASFKNSTDVEKTSGTAGVGLSIASDNITFNISYDVDVKDQYLGHGAQAKLSAKF